MDEVQRTGFDIGGGWYAKRGSDGSVTLYAPEPGDRELTPQQWASIVAAVSHHGEGDVSYRSAHGFHVGVDEIKKPLPIPEPSRPGGQP